MSTAVSYPEPLDHAVARAGRLRAALAHEPAKTDPWFVGRAEELDAVVEAVLGDWTAGALDAATAAGQLGKYLDELQSGMDVASTMGLLRNLGAERPTPPGAPRSADSTTRIPSDG